MIQPIEFKIAFLWLHGAPGKLADAHKADVRRLHQSQVGFPSRLGPLLRVPRRPQQQGRLARGRRQGLLRGTEKGQCKGGGGERSLKALSHGQKALYQPCRPVVAGNGPPGPLKCASALMPTRLIINADDFGLTPGINRAIAELYDAGALTSATLMATGPAFDDAVSIARARPGLGVGCHVVLTDGVPVSPPRSIPTLMASDGRSFRPKMMRFLAALLTNQIDLTDIEREARAQIERVQQAGLTVTHIDTHKHTHIFPQVLHPLLRAAAATGVHALRNPFEQPWAFPLSNGTAARTSQIRAVQVFQRRFLRNPMIRSGEMRTSEGTVGISATGSLDEVSLRNLVQALPAGTWELVCHPGYVDDELRGVATRLRETREVERRALLAVFARGTHVGTLQNKALPSSPELIHYGSLSSSFMHSV